MANPHRPPEGFVAVSCATCQRPATVANALAGKTVACPSCGAHFAAIPVASLLPEQQEQAFAKRRRPERVIGWLGFWGKEALNEIERKLLVDHEDILAMLGAKHGPNSTAGYLIVTNLRVIFTVGGFLTTVTGSGNLTFEHKDITGVEVTGVLTRTLVLHVFGRTETFKIYALFGNLETVPAIIREKSLRPPDQADSSPELLRTDDLVEMLPPDGLSKVVSVICPLCNQQQQAPYRMIGKNARCGGCTKPFKVPEPRVNPIAVAIVLVVLVVVALAVVVFCAGLFR